MSGFAIPPGFFGRSGKASPEVIQALGVILNALFDEPLIVKKEDPPKEPAYRYPDKARCRATSHLGVRCTKCLGHQDGIHRNRHLAWGDGQAKKKKKVGGSHPHSLDEQRPSKRRTKSKPKKKSPSRKSKSK